MTGECLPNLLEAKVVLRHSSLAEQAAQKGENLLAGPRDVTSVVQALCRLDTDVAVTSTFRQATKTSGNPSDDRDPEENDGMLSGEDLDGKRWPDADELDSFCAVGLFAVIWPTGCVTSLWKCTVRCRKQFSLRVGGHQEKW